MNFAKNIRIAHSSVLRRQLAKGGCSNNAVFIGGVKNFNVNNNNNNNNNSIVSKSFSSITTTTTTTTIITLPAQQLRPSIITNINNNNNNTIKIIALAIQPQFYKLLQQQQPQRRSPNVRFYYYYNNNNNHGQGYDHSAFWKEFERTEKYTQANKGRSCDTPVRVMFLLGLVIGFVVAVGIAKLKPEWLEMPDLIIGGDDDEDEEGDGDKEEGASSTIVSSPYKKKFLAFASVEKDGEKYMTFADFVKSLLPGDAPSVPAWVAHPRKLKNESKALLMFRLADSNGDDLLSLGEYSLFRTLLSNDLEKFKIAFKMYDTDNSGHISYDEFVHMLDATKSDKFIQIDFDNGVLKSLFGDDLKKQLSFDDFFKFIQSFKHDMLRAEFDFHDHEGNGYISVESFSELITTHVHHNSLNVPQFKKRLNLLKTNGFFKPTGRIDFETFEAFHFMSENLQDIGKAIELFTASGRPLKKPDFVRAVKSVANVEISNKVVDLVYALFDKNGDGSLEYKEFLDVLSNRAEAIAADVNDA